MENSQNHICPVTGMKITSSEQYTDLIFSPGYSVTYQIIEQNILLCRAKGSADLEGLKDALTMSKNIIKTHFNNKPFIYIEDFSNVTNPSTEGRKFYIQCMKQMKQMKGLIFFNVNSFLSLSIKLARKLNFFNFNVHVAKGYADALYTAVEILEDSKRSKIQRIGDNLFKSNPHWELIFDNFSFHCEIINDNILHIVATGIFMKENIGAALDLQIKIIKENFVNKSYYCIANFNNVDITRECRKLFPKKMQQLYESYPFKAYIYYGANRLTDIAVVFATQYIQFEIIKEVDLQAAIEYTKKLKRQSQLDHRAVKKEDDSGNIQQYIDEFLVFLGQINWESGEVDRTLTKDSNHPFHQVYDAITLIKSDLDELYLERKKNEEEKSILQHKLQQSLKLETMGKLAGSVAHDLNNVLSGIVSYPDIILKELPDLQENDKARKYIMRMKKSGQKAADIVQDLLTLSRSSVISFDNVHLNTIVEEYLNSPEYSRLKGAYPDIQLSTTFNSEIHEIVGSHIHLSKTVMNLVTNAFEAISGKGQVSISTTERRFRNKLIKGYENPISGIFIELSISDSGSGISEQDLPKIFEPFYSKKVMGRSGTGLGMVVVKGTVDDHNGFIDISSQKGKGTEFKLYFPVNQKDKTRKIIQKIDNYTGKGESILIVDDDEDQRIIAYKILKGLHYSVKTVSSGEEAIAMLRNEAFDLIVLDMIMAPGIGGLETYREIIKFKPGQRAIIVSGFSANNHVAETQSLGAGKYIRKPYTIEEIGTAVFYELKRED